VTQKELRRHPRRRLTLPARVEGYGADGTSWQEMTATIDVGVGGVSFNLEHAVKVGHVLLLSLPLPRQFRRYDLHSQSSYRVYSVVRTIGPGSPGRIAVLFLGRNPPKGFRENPTGRYLVQGDPAPGRQERRGFPRLPILLNVKIRTIAGTEERTVTENLSKWGARVMTSLPIEKGEVLKLGENMEILRPGKMPPGIHPRDLEAVNGKPASRDIPEGHGVTIEDAAS